MLHDAHGYWLHEAPSQDLLPGPEQDLDLDVAVVGGGYTGMWTAWHITQAEPNAKLAIFEAERCGEGPSGRNGGFVNSMWFSLATMRRHFGDRGARAVALESSRSVDMVGSFCKSQGLDAWYRKAGYLQVSAAPSQDGEWDEAFKASRDLAQDADPSHLPVRELSPELVAGRCRSPLFRGAAFYPDAATVQPARLARGLRASLLNAGVRIYEATPIKSIDDRAGAAELRTQAGHRVRAEQVVLGCGGAALRWRPYRRSLTVSSSHIVMTEPVPDVLEEIGWTGGECITDSRHLIHYFRTTPDGRILFGWGGGRVVRGSRLHGRAEIDPGVVEQVKTDLVRFFPQLEGRALSHAWGGPIDVSPTHLPVIQARGERTFAAFGYTGNGVGPSHLVGRTLASLALQRSDDLSRLPIIDPDPTKVPPEPIRGIGGILVRRALIAKEAAEELGRRPNPIASFIAGIPERIGVQVGR